MHAAHTHKYTHVYMHTYILINAYTYAYINTCMHAYTHAYVNTYMHGHIHTWGKAPADYNFSAVSSGLLCFITGFLYACFLTPKI